MTDMMINKTGTIDGVAETRMKMIGSTAAGIDIPDPINPGHYRSHPSGVECIQVTEHLDFLTGNAIKYLWRAPNKADITEQIIDLEKARWYIERRIALLQATP
jgi:hypothetical protein